MAGRKKLMTAEILADDPGSGFIGMNGVLGIMGKILHDELDPGWDAYPSSCSISKG